MREQCKSTLTTIEIPPDPYEKFLNAPVSVECPDDRFIVRRVRVDEFPRVYECVDAGFRKTRSREMYDWLYLKNPMGLARVWVVEEKSSNKILKTGAHFPWPVWCGDEPKIGGIGGDAATVPEWQRKGLSELRRVVRKGHAMADQWCTFAGPNAGSRIVAQKAGQGEDVLGPLVGGILPLNVQGLLKAKGIPGFLSTAVGYGAAGISRAWQSMALPGLDKSINRFESVSRFGQEIDEVTLRTMSFSGYWCPHSFRWLNWRYFDHPEENYLGFTLSKGDSILGYAVLRVDDIGATIAEFAASSDSTGAAAELLAGCIDVARKANCSYVNFFGAPGWKHWNLFRRAGLIRYLTRNFFESSHEADRPGTRDFNNWQVMPGDRDYH